MRKSVKIAALLIGMSFGLLCFSNPVKAEGNIAASIDKEVCELGETVSVTIEAQIPEGSAVPPQISVEYNPNRLEFTNCSCEYGGGGGGLVTINEGSATIDFTTLSGGEAEVKISGILSEDASETEYASVKISVNGEDTAVGTDAPSPSTTGVEAGTIETGDGRVVQTVFADEFMPSLFHKETCDYQGQTVECARFDMGDMVLLYTSDFSGNDGKFMIYNTATSEMSDFRMIQGIENRFIIVLNDCEGEIPAGYTKAVLDWNGQTLTAYMNMDAANGVVPTFNNLPASEFFLVYGLSSEGNRGWYQYDQNEGTYQRYFALAGDSDGGDVSNSGTTEESDDETFLDEYLSRKVQMILLLVFAGLVLVLLIVVIVLAVKSSDYDDYYGDDYYGAEEDDEEDAGYSRPKPGAITAASIVTSQMAEIPEVEDSGDDEDDEEDDESYGRRMSRREMKEARKEEKWRLKEEKKAARQRARGYEETTPMDWSSFEKDDSEDEDDDRRRYSKSRPPKYMKSAADPEDEEVSDESEEPDEDDVPIYSTKKSSIREEVEDEDDEEDRPPYVGKAKQESLPPRKQVTEEADDADRRNISKEEDQRERQKRLFAQQQRIEEQQQLEKQRREEEQKREQQQFIARQQLDEDLDEDFQFEFLNI